MIRPDAIPIREHRSRLTLPPSSIRELFGESVRLSGGERARIVSTSTGETPVSVVAGAQLRLELSRFDAMRLSGPGLRVVGPRGAVDAPASEVLRRTLVLPGGLLRAWRLSVGETVSIELGAVIFTDVEVAEGEPAGVSLDPADLAAAGARTGSVAALRRDVSRATAAIPGVGHQPSRMRGRLITENDVRQARLKGQRIEVRAGQKITPAAASLGRELGILDWIDG